jgi:hypothetical protein
VNANSIVRRLEKLEARHASARCWEETQAEIAAARAQMDEAFLSLVDAGQRPALAVVLDTHQGLQSWLLLLVSGQAAWPHAIPPALAQAYLAEPEASPLHDCEDCGLDIPIVACRDYGGKVEPARTLFASCPACGGRVGYYAFHLKHGHPPGPAATGTSTTMTT